MSEQIPNSCWAVTVKAVVGFASILLLVWLVGGETSAVLAGAS